MKSTNNNSDNSMIQTNIDGFLKETKTPLEVMNNYCKRIREYSIVIWNFNKTEIENYPDTKCKPIWIEELKKCWVADNSHLTIEQFNKLDKNKRKELYNEFYYGYDVGKYCDDFCTSNYFKIETGDIVNLKKYLWPDQAVDYDPHKPIDDILYINIFAWFRKIFPLLEDPTRSPIDQLIDFCERKVKYNYLTAEEKNVVYKCELLDVIHTIGGGERYHSKHVMSIIKANFQNYLNLAHELICSDQVTNVENLRRTFTIFNSFLYIYNLKANSIIPFDVCRREKNRYILQMDKLAHLYINEAPFWKSLKLDAPENKRLKFRVEEIIKEGEIGLHTIKSEDRFKLYI
jgi:hypothetical protein